MDTYIILFMAFPSSCQTILKWPINLHKEVNLKRKNGWFRPTCGIMLGVELSKDTWKKVSVEIALPKGMVTAVEFGGYFTLKEVQKSSWSISGLWRDLRSFWPGSRVEPLLALSQHSLPSQGAVSLLQQWARVYRLLEDPWREACKQPAMPAFRSSLFSSGKTNIPEPVYWLTKCLPTWQPSCPDPTGPLTCVAAPG